MIVVTLLYFFMVPQPALGKFQLFSYVTVTLYNTLEHDVLYMCSFKECNKTLQVLKANKKITWSFRQYGLPMYWVYLYIDEKTQGFFWAYAVRLRCIKCFWRIDQFISLYRGDRNRWERQRLFPPLFLNINKIKGSQEPTKKPLSGDEVIPRK